MEGRGVSLRMFVKKAVNHDQSCLQKVHDGSVKRERACSAEHVRFPQHDSTEQNIMESFVTETVAKWSLSRLGRQWHSGNILSNKQQKPHHHHSIDFFPIFPQCSPVLTTRKTAGTYVMSSGWNYYPFFDKKSPRMFPPPRDRTSIQPPAALLKRW